MRRFLSYGSPVRSRVIRGEPTNTFSNNSYNSDGYTPPENINMEEERQIENINENRETYSWEIVNIGTGGEPERPSIPVLEDETIENLNESVISSTQQASDLLRQMEEQMFTSRGIYGSNIGNNNRSRTNNTVSETQFRNPRIVREEISSERLYPRLSQESIEEIFSRRTRKTSTRLPKKNSIQINLNIKNE